MTATYQELLAQRQQLDREIEAAQAAQRAEALRQIRALVAEAGLTAADVFPPKKSASAGPVAAKFRDPETGAQWTGRGKEPTWIRGKDRAPFLIA